MKLLSVDPGSRDLGWAFFDGGRLLECGLSRTRLIGIEEKARAHYSNLTTRFFGKGQIQIVIEKPEVYQQRFWKGDPRDLIDLAVVAGALIPWTSNARMVFPKEWKGQVPREIEAKRTIAKLNADEIRVHQTPTGLGTPETVPPSLVHNVTSAIGIGLWALGR